MPNVFPSISALIPNLTHGNDQAWNNIFERFRSGLTSKVRFMIRATNSESKFNPDDLVQETFFKAWKQHTTFRGSNTSQFAHWLLTIMRNTYKDLYHKKSPELEIGSWHGFSNSDDTPSKIIISQEREAALHGCLSELDPRLQKVVALKHFEGLRFAQIAEHTGWNQNTVAGLYRRGISQLMHLLESEGYETKRSHAIVTNGGSAK